MLWLLNFAPGGIACSMFCNVDMTQLEGSSTSECLAAFDVKHGEATIRPSSCRTPTSFCALFRHVSTVSSCFNMFCSRLLRAQSHRSELNHSSTCIILYHVLALQGQSCSWNCMYDSTYRGARLWVGELIADDTAKRGHSESPGRRQKFKTFQDQKQKDQVMWSASLTNFVKGKVFVKAVRRAKSLSKLSEDQRRTKNPWNPWTPWTPWTDSVLKTQIHVLSHAQSRPQRLQEWFGKTSRNKEGIFCVWRLYIHVTSCYIYTLFILFTDVKKTCNDSHSSCLPQGLLLWLLRPASASSLVVVWLSWHAEDPVAWRDHVAVCEVLSCFCFWNMDNGMIMVVMVDIFFFGLVDKYGMIMVDIIWYN